MEKKTFGRGGRLTKWKGRVASVAPAMVFAIVAGSATAGTCTIDDGDLVSGNSATCEGSFSNETYKMPENETDVSLTNYGDWVYSGEILDNGEIIGPSKASPTSNYGGISIVNNGSIVWTDANQSSVGLVSNRTPSAMGAFYKTRTEGVSYTNNGSIDVTAGSGSVLSTISGIGAVAYAGDIVVTNSGEISLDISQMQSGYGAGMVAWGGDTATLQNSGTISVEAGSHSASAIDYSAGDIEGAAYAMGDASVENTGTLTVSGSGADLYGVSYWINPGQDDLTSLEFNNSGTITVENTTDGNSAGVFLQSAEPDVPLKFSNSGTIESTDYSLLVASGTEAAVNAENTGAMIGDVQTRSGDDSFLQTGAGSLTGEMHLGDGSDTAEFDGSDLSTITVLDGGDDVATADGFIDTLTLSNVTATLSGANVLNWETVELDASEVSFSNGALTTGEEDGYGLFLNSGTTLDVSGGFDLTGSLTNGALLTAMDDTAGDQIAVSGSYTGDGGTIELDAELGDDSSAADTLEVAGDVTGTSSIYVNVVGGTGAETDMGILLVDVSGTSAADAFSLANELEAGAFTYGLEYSNPDDSSDQNWYLRSTGTSGGGAAFESAPGVLLAFSELSTLEQRVGQRQWWGRDSEARGPLQPAEGAWIRMNASQSHTMADSTSGAELETTKWLLQAGWDAMLSENDNGRWVLGGFVQAGTISSDLTTETSSAKIDGTGFGLGITGTWYGNSGTYVDLQSLVSLTRADYSSAVAGELANDQDATALAFSAEVGHRMAVSEHTALVPQAQLSYARIWGGEFTDNQGTEVDLGTNDSLIGRLGLAYEYEYSEGWLFGDRAAAGPQHQREKVYAIANILHDFSDDSSVSVGSADLASSGQDTWGEIGLGGSMTWDENKVVYTEGSYRRAFDQGDDNWGASVEVGFRMSW